MMWLLILAMWIFGILSMRGTRWAYVAFVLLGLLYFPANVGFRLAPRACQLAVDVPLAFFSLTNYAHIVLFAIFFVMTSFQFRMDRASSFVKAALLTLAMGGMVELAEGVSGRGNCRFRDLVPDLAGAMLGVAVVFAAHRMLRTMRTAREKI